MLPPPNDHPGWCDVLNVAWLLPSHRARVVFCLRTLASTAAACVWVFHPFTAKLLPAPLLVAVLSVAFTTATLGATLNVAVALFKAGPVSILLSALQLLLVPAGHRIGLCAALFASGAIVAYSKLPPLTRVIAIVVSCGALLAAKQRATLTPHHTGACISTDLHCC